jgi:hypothetical protein
LSGSRLAEVPERAYTSSRTVPVIVGDVSVLLVSVCVPATVETVASVISEVILVKAINYISY